jgi:hypothetical protein
VFKEQTVMRVFRIGYLAFALSCATAAMAVPPANVAGVWTLTVDQQLETLDIAQGGPGLGVCPPITGKIGIATVRGFYCPGTGWLYFHHSNFTTDVTVRTFDGVVTAAANGLPMQVAGKVTVVNTVFAPHGDYPFSGSK